MGDAQEVVVAGKLGQTGSDRVWVARIGEAVDGEKNVEGCFGGDGVVKRWASLRVMTVKLERTERLTRA